MSTTRTLLVVAAVSGFAGVLAGTFGAHGLRGRISPEMLETWEIGVRYHLIHAVALLGVANAVRDCGSRLVTAAAWLCVSGIVLFSGSLYALALGGARWLAFVTPFGGLALLAAWATLGGGALRERRRAAALARSVAALGCALSLVSCASRSEQAPTAALPQPVRRAPAPAGAVGERSAWRSFTAPDGDFTIDFPALPQRREDETRTMAGRFDIVRFEAGDGAALFDAGYLVRKKSPLGALIGERGILDSACTGTAAQMGGKVVRSSSLVIDGLSARDIEIEIPSASPSEGAVARLVLAPQRIYHAIVRAPRDRFAEVEAARFVESLRVCGAAVADAEASAPLRITAEKGSD